MDCVNYAGQYESCGLRTFNHMNFVDYMDRVKLYESCGVRELYESYGVRELYKSYRVCGLYESYWRDESHELVPVNKLTGLTPIN